MPAGCSAPGATAPSSPALPSPRPAIFYLTTGPAGYYSTPGADSGPHHSATAGESNNQATYSQYQFLLQGPVLLFLFAAPFPLLGGPSHTLVSGISGNSELLNIDSQ